MQAVLFLCAGLAIGSFVMYVVTPTAQPPAKIPPHVSLGEVTDLIERLKPLAERPNDDWRGIRIIFTGASASVELRTKDGNEYSGKGLTLAAAVTMIDSTRIREALAGWVPASQNEPQ